MTIQIPLWSLWFLIPVIGFFVSAWKIGKPEEGGGYGVDIITPMMHVISFLFWLLVATLVYISGHFIGGMP